MKDSNKENKPKVPKLKFSSYWIYGGVFLLLIAFQFFNSGSLDSKTPVSYTHLTLPTIYSV